MGPLGATWRLKECTGHFHSDTWGALGALGSRSALVITKRALEVNMEPQSTRWSLPLGGLGGTWGLQACAGHFHFDTSCYCFFGSCCCPIHPLEVAWSDPFPLPPMPPSLLFLFLPWFPLSSFPPSCSSSSSSPSSFFSSSSSRAYSYSSPRPVLLLFLLLPFSSPPCG